MSPLSLPEWERRARESQRQADRRRIEEVDRRGRRPPLSPVLALLAVVLLALAFALALALYLAAR